jgi:hypothetical protein
MGCWNGTCGLSRLPIGWNDEVYAFILLRPRELMNGTSGLISDIYTRDQYLPILPPIKGRYDDYGALDKVEETWVTKELKKIITLDHDNSNTKHHQCNLENTIEILKSIERGVAEIKIHRLRPGQSDRGNLALMLVRSEIYDFVQARMKEFDNNQDDYYYKYRMEDLKNFEDTVMACHACNKDDLIKYLKINCMRTRFERRFFLIMETQAILIDKIASSKEEYEEILPLLTDHNRFCRYMEMTRNIFTEQGGLGSQDTNYLEMRALSQKIIEVCDKELTDQE